MRLLNWLLHLVIVAILCCGFDLHAQTQGNLPNVIDGAIDSIIGPVTDGVINWPENVAVGDTLVTCNDTDQAGGPFAMADTLGNSWTCTTPTQTPAPATNGLVNMCYAKSTFAGADTLTYSFPGTSGHMVGGRFSGLGAVDGSLGTATLAGPFVGGTSTISTSQTTTVNNAMQISCGGVSAANTGQWLAPASGEIVAHEPGFPVLSIIRTGTKGSQSATLNTWNGPGGFARVVTSFAMQTLAFKPNTNIALADTKLPDAASGITYEADLHCIGGTASQTYSLVSGSLPTGLSLNTANGKITGSTTSLGTTSLGFQCTDGSITSATDTLPLTVGGGFNVPFIRSYTSTFDGVHGTVTGAQCGDMIHVLARGTDTHSDSGWVQTVTGIGNFVADTLNSPVQRMLLPIAGTPDSPIIDYAIGPLTHGGTDVITIANNQSANSGLPVSGIFDVANVQGVSDQGALAESILQTGSLAPSFTSVVPNTLLLTAGTTLVGGSVTASLGAPFTPNSIDSDSFGYSIFGNALIASPGSTTATYSVASSTFFGQWGAVIVPLRPALPNATCSAFTGTGEKRRRGMN